MSTTDSSHAPRPHTPQQHRRDRSKTFGAQIVRGLSFHSRTHSHKAKEKPIQLARDSSFDGSIECPRVPTRLSQQEAEAMEHELTKAYGFSTEQQLELLGLASAVAFTKAYPKESLKKAHGAFLVCCGTGLNGATGLVCARHLKSFGYRPTVYCVRSSTNKLVNALICQCEKLEISSLGYLPSDRQLINEGYNAIIDCVFGYKFKPPLRADYEDVICMMKRIKIPIMSIDVPSGWDVENGCSDGIQPDCLVSLLAPKKCARYFKGRLHFIGGRYLPRLLMQKFDLNLPNYTGSDPCVEVTSLNSASASEVIDKDYSNPSLGNDKVGHKEHLNDSVWGAD